MLCEIKDYIDDPDGYIACWASYFDADCYDCLCDYILAQTGVACP